MQEHQIFRRRIVPALVALIALAALLLIVERTFRDPGIRPIDVRSLGASAPETADPAPSEGATAGEQTDDARQTDDATPAEKAAPVPRAVALESCMATSAYEYEWRPPTDLRQVYLDPDLGPGGPVIAVTGPSLGTTASAGQTRRQLLPERDPMGKVLVTDDRTGEALTSIDSKRASSDGLLMVARHVLDGEELDDTFATVDAPEQRDAVRVFGTSCEIQGEFYGVEVVAGGLFERSAYMLSVDPVRSEEDGGATIAVFGPPGKSIPLRVLSADEWQQMKQSQDSSLDGADG